MAGETSTDRQGPSPGPLIPFPGWDPRGPNIKRKRALFTSLGPFSAIVIVVGIGGFGPFETLGAPFSRGPQGLVPPPTPHLWNHLSSPVGRSAN